MQVEIDQKKKKKNAGLGEGREWEGGENEIGKQSLFNRTNGVTNIQWVIGLVHSIRSRERMKEWDLLEKRFISSLKDQKERGREGERFQVIL